MTPIEQAFEAWFKGHEVVWDGWGIISRDSCHEAFEAGYRAALYAASVAKPKPAIEGITAEDVYAAYPRKVARSAAIKAIQKAAKAVGMEKLLKAVKAYAEATSRWPVEERQYIPHPATWVNRGSYDDDPKEWERGTAHVSQFSVTH